MIVGTGTAAMVAAIRSRAAGWTVAIIDFRPFGGTCALRGCDPKKMLIASAETVDSVGRMRGRGMAGDVKIDWPELIAFKRTFTDPIPQKREHDYAERGIDTFHGHARVTDRNTMGVDGTALEGRHFLIAAGAEPIKLGIPGAEHLVTHEDFLALESLPRRIVLVGGGYIAAEFAHIAARAGAQVTIVQRDERMLKHFDPDLVGWLMEKFRAIGVDVHTRTTVEAIEKTDSRFTVGASSSHHRSDVLVEFMELAQSSLLVVEAADVAIRHARDLPLGSLDRDLESPQPSPGSRRSRCERQLLVNRREPICLAVLAPLDVPGRRSATRGVLCRCIRSRVHYRLAALQRPSRSFRHPAVV